MTTSQNRPSLAPAKPGQGSSVLQGTIRAPLGEISTNTNSLPMRLLQRPSWNQVAPFIIEVFLTLFFAPIYLSILQFSHTTLGSRPDSLTGKTHYPVVLIIRPELPDNENGHYKT